MLADLLTEAKSGAKAGKPPALLLRPGLPTQEDKAKMYRRHQSSVRCVAIALRAREARRHDMLSLLYGAIADNRAPYVLGGARRDEAFRIISCRRSRNEEVKWYEEEIY